MMRLAVLLLCLSAQAVMAQTKQVKFTWTASANPGWNNCTAGNWCLTGYNFYEMTSGTPVLLGSVPQTTMTYSINPMPSVGTHAYMVAQSGTNGAGAAVQSTCNQSIMVTCQKNTSGGRNCSIGTAW